MRPEGESAALPQPGSVSEAGATDVQGGALEQRIWSELRQVYDPELPVNIVELGLVYAVATAPLPEGGNLVEVLMTVTSPGCGMSEMLRAETEARLSKLPDVREVAVAVTFDPPWTPDRMSESARLLLNL